MSLVVIKPSHLSPLAFAFDQTAIPSGSQVGWAQILVGWAVPTLMKKGNFFCARAGIIL